MTTSFGTKTVGELVAERPSRSRVFESCGIDYCCGGKQSLSDACANRSLAIEEVMAALQECDNEPSLGSEREWTEAPLSELIDSIVEQHHEYLRRELPRLDALNAKVCNAHGADNENLAICHALFRGFSNEIQTHMMKEEQILFPAIKRLEAGERGSYCFDTIASPIAMMEAEHDLAGGAIARMRSLTNGFSPPTNACNTYRVWLEGLSALEKDMHTHVHKENSILFPRALALESGTAVCTERMTQQAVEKGDEARVAPASCR